MVEYIKDLCVMIIRLALVFIFSLGFLGISAFFIGLTISIPKTFFLNIITLLTTSYLAVFISSFIYFILEVIYEGNAS